MTLEILAKQSFQNQKSTKMNQKSLQSLLAVVVAAAPVVYAAYIFPQLPAEVPLHFGADGQPDRYGAKSELWFPILILAGVSLLTYFLVPNVGKIDPKKSADRMPETLQKIGIAVVFFMAGLNFFVLHSTLSGGAGTKTIAILMGVFFAYLGNLMHSMKPNYFVGIRLPWTLENETNWRKTHQFASKIWVAGGLIVVALSLLLPDRLALPVLIAFVLLMVMIPTIYSFLLYRKMQTEK